jgi:putative transposase
VYHGGVQASISPPKERYAVSQDNGIKLAQPEEFCDALAEVLRQGARTLLAQTVEAEGLSFLKLLADKRTEDGHRQLVLDGHLPEREIATGIGHVGVRQPGVGDRGARGAERIRFTPGS